MNKTMYQSDSWMLPLLQQTARFFAQEQHQAYLVGGSVRNLLLQEPCVDWDIVSAGDFQKLGRQLANHLGGFYAPMHERACRVVIKHAEQELIIDLAPLHGTSIEADLHDRDFTLNAIAVPLSAAVQAFAEGLPLPLIDPLHGAADLEARLLRAVSDDVFIHDPLRMLRAVRFTQRYALSLESQTARLISRDASLIFQAAAERIQEELYAILRPAGAIHRLRQIDTLGLLSALIPELDPARGMPQPALHNWDVFDHSLESVATLELLTTTLTQTPDVIRRSPLEVPEPERLQNAQSVQAAQTIQETGGHLAALAALLREAEQQQIFTFATLSAPATKLATLLHDIGKPPTYAVDDEGAISFYHHPQVGIPVAQQITQRLHISTHDRRLIQQAVAHHMRPGQLSHDTVTPRAVRRYFVDLGPTGILVALISLADHLAMRGPLPLTEHWQRHLATVRLLLTRYIRERELILPPRLLQADELMRRFQLTPGPIIGKLLEQIAEAQADGRVNSKEEAIWLVEEVLLHHLP
jgi:poly(A) polymerase